MPIRLTLTYRVYNASLTGLEFDFRPQERMKHRCLGDAEWKDEERKEELHVVLSLELTKEALGLFGGTGIEMRFLFT